MDSEGRTASEVVVATISELKGVDPTTLRPLHEVVDPEALDTVFRDGAGRVSFEYEGYAVTVDNESGVEASPLAESGGRED